MPSEVTSTLTMSSIGSGLKESEIADELSNIQENFKMIDIGSYPYFKDKAGTVLVLRSTGDVELKKCEIVVNN